MVSSIMPCSLALPYSGDYQCLKNTVLSTKTQGEKGINDAIFQKLSPSDDICGEPPSGARCLRACRSESWRCRRGPAWIGRNGDRRLLPGDAWRKNGARYAASPSSRFLPLMHSCVSTSKILDA